LNVDLSHVDIDKMLYLILLLQVLLEVMIQKLSKSILLSMLALFILVTELLITGMHSVVHKYRLVQLLLLRGPGV